MLGKIEGSTPQENISFSPQINKLESKPLAVDIRTLLPQKPSCITKTQAIKCAIMIVFAPITLLVYLIVRSLSQVAVSQGLGSLEEIKDVNAEQRETLKNELGGQEIKFGLKSQAVLEGMYFKADPHPSISSPKTILICTGSHKSYEKYAISMVRDLKTMGHNVMVFNYEGFGNSEGKPSEDGVYRSVEAAYQYLKQEKGCPDESIVAWGYSLGSGAATELASNHKVDIVIDRGFSSMSQKAYEAAPDKLRTVAKIIFMIGAHFDNLRKISEAKGKVFIAQGKNDETMPTDSHGKLLGKKLLGENLESNSKAIYKEVDSDHFHDDTQTWFSQGADREAVEEFLRGSGSVIE